MSDKLYSEMPMIALRGLVIFPSVQLHFDVGRPQISCRHKRGDVERPACVSCGSKGA